jgi:hypothetical protein
MFRQPDETTIPEELRKLWAERDIAQVSLEPEPDAVPSLEMLDEPAPSPIIPPTPVISSATAPTSTINIYSGLSLFPKPLDISKYKHG